jgi:iron complex transport system permease protein
VRHFGLVKLLFIVAVSAAVCAGVAYLATCVGSTGDFGWPAHRAVLDERLTRVAQAMLVGAALAGAGVAYQAVLRNDLADPYLLGVASGASLGSYLWKLPAFAAIVASLHPALASVSQQVFAFGGGLTAAIVVLGVAGWRGRLEPTVLVLVGVILSTVVASVLLLIHTLVKTQPGSGYYQSVMIGELVALPPWHLSIASVVAIACMVELFRRAGRLNLTRLEDDEAASLGLSVRRERWVVMLLASLLTATAVAVSGPIGFVGLICPHLARAIVGSDARRLMPASISAGACLLMLADAGSRYLAATGRLNQMLPVGVITSLAGGPFFLLLLLRKSNGRVGA